MSGELPGHLGVQRGDTDDRVTETVAESESIAEEGIRLLKFVVPDQSHEARFSIGG
jgi:hypothetical protein